jgi:hypothetical protein
MTVCAEAVEAKPSATARATHDNRNVRERRLAASQPFSGSSRLHRIDLFQTCIPDGVDLAHWLLQQES